VSWTSRFSQILGILLLSTLPSTPTPAFQSSLSLSLSLSTSRSLATIIMTSSCVWLVLNTHQHHHPAHIARLLVLLDVFVSISAQKGQLTTHEQHAFAPCLLLGNRHLFHYHRSRRRRRPLRRRLRCQCSSASCSNSSTLVNRTRSTSVRPNQSPSSPFDLFAQPLTITSHLSDCGSVLFVFFCFQSSTIHSPSISYHYLKGSSPSFFSLSLSLSLCCFC
jgi:hypothetical protein